MSSNQFTLPDSFAKAFNCPLKIAELAMLERTTPLLAAVVSLGHHRVRYSYVRTRKGRTEATCWVLDGKSVTEGELIAAAERRQLPRLPGTAHGIATSNGMRKAR